MEVVTQGVWGVTLNFFWVCTQYLLFTHQKYKEYQAYPKKIFEILTTPKNIPILFLDLKAKP